MTDFKDSLASCIAVGDGVEGDSNLVKKRIVLGQKLGWFKSKSTAYSELEGTKLSTDITKGV